MKMWHQTAGVDVARLVWMYNSYNRRSQKFLCQPLSGYSNVNFINELFFFLHRCVLFYRLCVFDVPLYCLCDEIK